LLFVGDGRRLVLKELNKGERKMCWWSGLLTTADSHLTGPGRTLLGFEDDLLDGDPGLLAPDCDLV